jgi:hypothetical protein
MDSDLETLRAVFASRVQFAKKTVEEALEDARKEHRNVLDWVRSNSTKEGSFCWYCDIFDLEADAVRRAIKEKRT